MKNEVVASLLVLVIILSSAAGYFVGVTASHTTTVTTTTTTMASNSSSRLYELVFNQTGYCPPPPETYIAPWGVTLNNKTMIVEPPMWSLPLPSGDVEFRPSYKNSSVIAFSVPNGSYSYVIYPDWVFNERGTVMINGSDLVVQVEVNGIVVPCMAH